MLYDFHVNYDTLDGAHVDRVVRAETEAEAEGMVRTTLGPVRAVAVSRGLPVLNPQQTWFRMQDAAAYCSCSYCHISEAMAAGQLPAAKSGRPAFRREELDAWMESGRKKMPKAA